VRRRAGFFILLLAAIGLALVLPRLLHLPERGEKGAPGPAGGDEALPAATESEGKPAKAVLLLFDGEASRRDFEASALGPLLGHFRVSLEPGLASSYRRGELEKYSTVFYFAGGEGLPQEVAAELSSAEQTLVLVGGGRAALVPPEMLERLGIRELEGDGQSRSWQISFRGQSYGESWALPRARLGPGAEGRVVSWARAAGEATPFVMRSGKLWFFAARPEADKNWSLCIWAEVLHTVLGEEHGEGRRLFPMLADLPLYVRPAQVAAAASPLLEGGLPVILSFRTRMGSGGSEVILTDRPAFGRGLRAMQEKGATTALMGAASGAREGEAGAALKLAWEAGLFPVAWVGPSRGRQPFGLRLAPGKRGLPFASFDREGAIVSAQVKVGDGGGLSPQEQERLRQCEVVRDSAVVVSFGLFARPEAIARFFGEQAERGWEASDLRDLPVVVRGERRLLASGSGVARMSVKGAYLREAYLDRGCGRREKGPARKVEGRARLAYRAEAGELYLAEVSRVKPGAALSIKGVGFDPAAYEGSGVGARELAELLSTRWAKNGINTVFVYAYNVDTGAAYRTNYRGARMGELGKQGLLGHLIRACHQKGVKVVAWFYSGRDKEMWRKHPEWREKRADGSNYNPPLLDTKYFLCARNPEFRRWWLGLLEDLARRHPDLDGIEVSEPIYNWWGSEACYCGVCRREFARRFPGERPGGEAWRRFRAEALTEFLHESVAQISRHDMESYVMTVPDCWDNGAILSAERQARETGFDLEGLLAGKQAPTYVNFEVIWQQWAKIAEKVHGEKTFNPEWAGEATAELIRRVEGRGHVLVHVEMTDFGRFRMGAELIEKTIDRIAEARPGGVDCYDSAALDRKRAWSALKRAYEEKPWREAKGR
jgi:hypothetical protein